MSKINHRGHGDHGGWIPVSENLPDDETEVIIHTADDDVATGFLDAGVWRYTNAARVHIAVLNWQHLPEPPEEGAK